MTSCRLVQIEIRSVEVEKGKVEVETIPPVPNLMLDTALHGRLYWSNLSQLKAVKFQ